MRPQPRRAGSPYSTSGTRPIFGSVCTEGEELMRSPWDPTHPGSPTTSWRRRQHPLDRPALATPVQQCLDPDAQSLRPLHESECLAVPGEHIVAAVSLRSWVIAGRPETRQVPRLVELSPLRVLAQRQIGLSLQGTPELLVRVGPLAGRGTRPGASLVGHVGPSWTSTPGRYTDPARQRAMSSCTAWHLPQ